MAPDSLCSQQWRRGAIPEDPVAVQGVLEGSPHHPHPEHVPGPRRCPQRDAGSPAVLQAGEALWL